MTMPHWGSLKGSVCHPPSSSTTRPLLFYKLIMPSILEAKELRLPHDFVEKIGGQLSDIMKLTVPDGRVWNVGLRKAGETCWFYYGWQEFVENYSICVGFLLVFTYRGNSNFNVNIYDVRTSEINYSNSPQIPEGPIRDEHMNFTEENVVANLDPAEDANHLQATVPLTQDIGIQVNEGEDVDPACEVELVDANQGSGRTVKEWQRIKPSRAPIRMSKRRRDVLHEKRRSMINAAETFRPENPFCKVIMRRSYVNGGFLLHIPIRFSEEHLRGVSRLITLQVSSGKQWPVHCLSGKGKSKRLCKGWPRFVSDNNLEEGDVCVFELTKMENVVLNVSIFHVLEDVSLKHQTSN